MKIHPVAELFPLLEGEAFDALVGDIRLYGLRDPILIDPDQQILDGRNRLRACEAAGREPRFEVWRGDDPVALIISKNLHRRHLSESQRALIAGQLSTMRLGDNQHTVGPPIGGPTADQRAMIAAMRLEDDVPSPPIGRPAISVHKAAELLNVGTRSVERAKFVLERGTPAVIEAVERGDLAVSAAATEIRAGRNPLDVHFRSDSPEHYTPTHILAAVIDCLGAIDLDPCSNSHDEPHVPAAAHFTREDDGLSRDWFGRVFLNPPYGREIDPWIAKLITELEAGHVTQAIALVPGRIDTAWFGRFRDFVRCEIEGRLTFIGNSDPAPFPSVLMYLDGDGLGNAQFYRCFSHLGDIWQRVPAAEWFGE